MQFPPHAVQQRTQASAGVRLLLALACALCGLVTVQWFQDARLRDQITLLNRRVADLTEQKKSVESAAGRVEQELKRLESLRKLWLEQVATNKLETVQLRKDAIELRQQVELAHKQGEAYKDAYERQKAIIAQANETIRKANDSTKQLAQDRDGLVTKYNELATKQEALIVQYNALADRLKKALESGAGLPEREKK